MGLVAFFGLLALKTPGHRVLTGTLGPIFRLFNVSCGAGVIQTNLAPLATLIEQGFGITGVVPNNEGYYKCGTKS